MEEWADDRGETLGKRVIVVYGPWVRRNKCAGMRIEGKNLIKG